MDLKHPPRQLTPQQIMEEANGIRERLQIRTCCADHALSVAMICAGTFALDGMSAETAARELVRVATAVATDIREGNFTLVRQLHS